MTDTKALIAEAREVADSDEHAWICELWPRHDLLRRLAAALEEAQVPETVAVDIVGLEPFNDDDRRQMREILARYRRY